ncbi:hypothetical protein SK128_000112 [Halocaridina rubra]|uniref:Selenoprotein O n=1 Tax=Halocaridina rubra TaxID=373956 RepID=A0AAN8WPK3_HALRR
MCNSDKEFRIDAKVNDPTLNQMINEDVYMAGESPKSSFSLIKDIRSKDWKLSSEVFLNFPLDPISENYVRRNVKNAIFSRVKPTKLQGQIFLAGISPSALDLIDLDPSVILDTKFQEFASGSWIHPSSFPLAHRYGGYQFGWWAEQLGDGRAHLLGHYVNRNGSWWELQLKGSGKTPYSRDGDGRAVVRSSVREFLAAEYMDALGFRTSRCASIVVGDELALRDQFYNGNLEMEKTAVVLRLSPTWFRFGSLEILSKKNELENLRFLVDHIIAKHFKSISTEHPDRYLSFLSTVVEDTAEMIAQWQSIGFAHGVMNTDNMSILSLTIDYGPFGFMDAYNPSFVPNSSDDDGMYSYKNQPKIGFSNIRKLSEALQPLLMPYQMGQIKNILAGYDHHFQLAYLKQFSKKLGLKSLSLQDGIIVNRLLEMMADNKADFTMTFWELGNITLGDLENKKVPKGFWALKKIVKDKRFPEFIQLYKTKLQEDGITENSRQSLMTANNPRYVLRNWIAQQTIEEVERGNYSALEEVLGILRNPFIFQKAAEGKGFANSPPVWSTSLKVSCSS